MEIHPRKHCLKHWLVTASVPALLLGASGAGVPAALAQEATAPAAGLTGPFPVGIHSGTCADPVAEPAYDAGLMELVPLAISNVLDDPAAFNDDDAIDLLDEDDDDVLGEDELLVVANPVVGFVYKADTEIDADGEELVREGPYVVAVHESEESYGTIIACGEVLPIVEEDQVVVPLVGVDNPDLFGVAMIPEDDGELAAYLFQRGQTAS